MVVPPAFVADTSFTMPWIFADEIRTPACDAAWEALRTASVTIHAPALWLLEVSNSLRNRERNGKITKGQIDQFLNVLAQAPVFIAHIGLNEIFFELPHFVCLPYIFPGSLRCPILQK